MWWPWRLTNKIWSVQPEVHMGHVFLQDSVRNLLRFRQPTYLVRFKDHVLGWTKPLRETSPMSSLTPHFSQSWKKSCVMFLCSQQRQSACTLTLVPLETPFGPELWNVNNLIRCNMPTWRIRVGPASWSEPELRSVFSVHLFENQYHLFWCTFDWIILCGWL